MLVLPSWSYFLVYIDDCLLLSTKDKHINQGIQNLCTAEPRFNMEDHGTVNDFLGIQVKHKKNGEIILTQPQLIASILSNLHLQKDNVITCKTLCLSTILLHKDPTGKPMNTEFNYHSVIGKLNFLEKSARPDITYAVHQCACFSADPKQSHADAVKRIGQWIIPRIMHLFGIWSHFISFALHLHFICISHSPQN